MTKTVESLMISKGGKGQAVRRLNPKTEQIEDVCECWYNVDFSRGCIAQVHVTTLQEVIDNHGHYAFGNLRKYVRQGLADQRCAYCYSYTNMGGIYPRLVTEKTRASFERNKPKLIRIGKVTEGGHPYYYESFMKFLELCKEYKTQIIFPTKAFSFGLEGALETEQFAIDNNPVVANLAKTVGMKSGKEIAQDLKQVGGSLMYSIGWNKCERGLVSQGFTNEWRITQAEKYHREGVNTSLTVVYFISQSIDENIKRGSAIKLGLESRERTGINIRILPLRIKSDKVAKSLTGESYQGLKRRENGRVFPEFECLFNGNKEGLCDLRGNSELVSIELHPDFLQLVEQGIGVCGQAGDYEHCDKCNLQSERIRFPVVEIVEVNYTKRQRKADAIKKRRRKNQKRLF